MNPTLETITLLGTPQAGGTYLLRIRVYEHLLVQFGRFANGRSLPIPPADYVYIGSALGQRGSMSLARRLLRHASRSGNQPPHPIRAQLLDLFQPIQPPPQKNLRWHVDYLLDELASELVQMIVVQSSQRLEGVLGQLLLTDVDTAVIAPGLGAADIKGNTHILQIPADDSWWHTLTNQIQASYLEKSLVKPVP